MNKIDQWFNRAYFLFVLFVAGQLVMSCSEEENTNTIGFSKNTTNYKVVSLDTFTVKVSTVLMDSIKTSGSGRILVGHYFDPKIGKVSASSYLSIAPASWSLEDNAVFDSMALILKYDDYYYGDTTQAQKITVTQLKKDIVGRTKKDGYVYDDIPYSYFYGAGTLYNSSSIPDYGVALGSVTYYPRPISKDSISIRLSDQLGKDWFAMKKVDDQDIASDAAFDAYFKGLKITSTASPAAAAIGFASATAHLRIYYRTLGATSDLDVKKYFDFTIYNSTLQFNQIVTDRSGTLLSTAVPFKPLPSEQTNNETFVQAGGGLMTKIEFPYLSKIFEVENNLILIQANLLVVPELDNSSASNLPKTLSLYYTNTTNVPIGQILSESSTTAPQTATLVSDDEYENTASYTFLFTTYMSSILKKNTVPPYSILLGTTAASFENEITKVRIGTGKTSNSKIKLKIYYSTY